MCVLNVHHNCQGGGCRVTLTGSTQIERMITSIRKPEVTHQPTNSYLINASALYSPEEHREHSGHSWNPVPVHQWGPAVDKGLKAWVRAKPPKVLA